MIDSQSEARLIPSSMRQVNIRRFIPHHVQPIKDLALKLQSSSRQPSLLMEKYYVTLCKIYGELMRGLEPIV
ncbi:hypothetical protein TNCV_1807171 [Trichonephila clavipes]|nr:hypothetical protein TNCV_1807171 [Trichonephila clavipes]